MRFTYAEAMTDATYYVPLAQAAAALDAPPRRLLAAAVNLARLAVLGLHRTATGWAVTA